jgi:hypothetical protein
VPSADRTQLNEPAGPGRRQQGNGGVIDLAAVRPTGELSLATPWRTPDTMRRISRATERFFAGLPEAVALLLRVSASRPESPTTPVGGRAMGN